MKKVLAILNFLKVSFPFQQENLLARSHSSLEIFLESRKCEERCDPLSPDQSAALLLLEHFLGQRNALGKSSKTSDSQDGREEHGNEKLSSHVGDTH